MENERTKEPVPEPPWWTGARRRAASRPRLSREAIVEAALSVLDREGLDAVSMRRVAEELGAGAASLYWHVGGKDELLDMVFDRVLGEVRLPRPDPLRWQEQVKEATREMRRVATSHRDFSRLQVGRFPMGPNGLPVVEGLLALLRSGGLSERASAYAAYLLPLYANAFTAEQSSSRTSPPAGDEATDRRLAAVRGYLASLPAERFPNMAALREDLTAPAADERFEFGLDLIVRGLAASTDS